MIGDRLSTFDSTSTGLTFLTDREILSVFKKGSGSGGWSNNTITSFNGRKLFMKLLPLPALELSHPYDTRNLYHLPLEMNRSGIGVNTWRELLVLVKTTNWVLSGRIYNFPLLYHYRIVKRRSRSLNSLEIRDYVERWGNKRGIRERTEDAQNSQYSLLLCIEYIGPTLVHWLNSRRRLELYLSQTKMILGFLESEGVLLFDNHSHNILTDNHNNIYFTDFGLVLDRQFELTESERRFFQTNITYPYAYAFSNPFFLVFDRQEVLNSLRIKFDLKEDITIRDDILPHLLEFCKLMGFTARGVSILQKYGDIVTKFGKAHETFPMKYPSKVMDRLIWEVK